QCSLQPSRQGGDSRACEFADRNRGAAARGGVISPVGAARFGIERVDAARGARDEQPFVQDGGLAEFRAARVAVGPFHRELRPVAGANRRFGLVASIVETPAPAVPLRIAESDGTGGTWAWVVGEGGIPGTAQ